MITLAWLFLFYNIERIYEPIKIATYVYVLALSYSVLIIGYTPFLKASVVWIYGLPLVLLLVLKAGLGNPILGVYWPVTVIEVCAVCVTLFLARWVAVYVDQIAEAVSDLMASRQTAQLETFDLGQSEMYRQVRRARNDNSPLSLVTITATPPESNRTIQRLIKEAQRKTTKKYIENRLANLVRQQTNNRVVLARDNGHLVMVFPETTPKQASDIVQQVAAAAEESLGITLETGIADFPDEEVTFTGLLERAENRMRAPDTPRPLSDHAQRKPVLKLSDTNQAHVIETAPNLAMPHKKRRGIGEKDKPLYPVHK